MVHYIRFRRAPKSHVLFSFQGDYTGFYGGHTGIVEKKVEN